ncbi:homeodomain transcription factor [Mycena albidolilacea]|uniref:Homeodomain transcription factor n=1 Tax=Mycena albidolilacea TaxID=1033008 RepID=A0AAD7AMY6_9AGAR|nr:homeodomain transcription factor [Mycena albidolilacea]
MPAPRLEPLSRTSSVTSTGTSTSSDDLYATFINESTDATTRRTRKRFTNAQLMMLEQLFHQNSHPSREQRESVARSANMEVKSVTIWFQNKRQTERRTTLASGRVLPTVIINSSRDSYSYSRPPSPVQSPSMASVSSASSTSTSTSRRPSLDCVASRSELRAPAPRTPSRRHNPHAPLWENMPSSPVGPQFSPPARDYVEFGQDQRTRTLEWACARRRLKGKAERSERGGSSSGGERGRRGTGLPSLMSDDENTDVETDETHEAVTPPSTWSGGDTRWSEASGKDVAVKSAGPRVEPDDDTMKAALALCGLMRG